MTILADIDLHTHPHAHTREGRDMRNQPLAVDGPGRMDASGGHVTG